MLTIRLLGVALTCWAFCLNTAWSDPVTIGFPPPVFDKIISSYSEQGFTFSAERMEYGADYRGGSPATDGSLSIESTVRNPALRFGQDSGRTFDLLQISLQTSAYSSTGPMHTSTETFTGYLLGGGTVQQSFDITQNWQTFSFSSAFNNLLYATMTQNAFYGVRIDDVVVRPLGIPEPSTWAVLAAGVGLLGVGVLRRRTA